MKDAEEVLPATTQQPGEIVIQTVGEQDFSLIQRKAQALAASDLVPEAFRGNVANCMIAVGLARQLSMAEMTVMQNLHVIRGKPTFGSSFLIGCVNATQRFTPLRFRFTGKPNTDEWGCRAYATDSDSGIDVEGPIVTWKTVQEEGWSATKKGQKSKWVTMTELMFMYRSGAWFARLYAPEIFMGLLTLDELQDIEAQDRAQSIETATAASDAAGAAIDKAATAARDAGEVAGDDDSASRPSDESAQPPAGQETLL